MRIWYIKWTRSVKEYEYENENENGKRKMENGKWRMENGEWRMENGKWKMENGKWKMENGKWKMKNEKWKMKNEKTLWYFSQSHRSGGIKVTVSTPFDRTSQKDAMSFTPPPNLHPTPMIAIGSAGFSTSTTDWKK
jgi:hypothetical protein